jgi:hypothetical protein
MTGKRIIGTNRTMNLNGSVRPPPYHRMGAGVPVFVMAASEERFEQQIRRCGPG